MAPKSVNVTPTPIFGPEVINANQLLLNMVREHEKLEIFSLKRYFSQILRYWFTTNNMFWIAILKLSTSPIQSFLRFSSIGPFLGFHENPARF